LYVCHVGVYAPFRSIGAGIDGGIGVKAAVVKLAAEVFDFQQAIFGQGAGFYLINLKIADG
jgi:hypothetical protein